jgi:uncharacterized protein
MRTVFADAGYWIALLNPKDPLHSKAFELSRSVEAGRTDVVTSQMVLAEVLNYFAGFASIFRARAASFVHSLEESAVVVIPQDKAQFAAALALYEARPDKEWGLTDCASIVIMQELEISEVFAYDRHFEQAGFRALLR